MVAGPRNRPPHSYAASEKLNSVVRGVQTGPPALDFASSSRRACVPPFLRLDLIFREPYLAEAVTSLKRRHRGPPLLLWTAGHRLIKPMSSHAIRARMTAKHSPQLE